jgi:hypothetical protein
VKQLTTYDIREDGHIRLKVETCCINNKTSE